LYSKSFFRFQEYIFDEKTIDQITLVEESIIAVHKNMYALNNIKFEKDTLNFLISKPLRETNVVLHKGIKLVITKKTVQTKMYDPTTGLPKTNQIEKSLQTQYSLAFYQNNSLIYDSKANKFNNLDLFLGENPYPSGSYLNENGIELAVFSNFIDYLLEKLKLHGKDLNEMYSKSRDNNTIDFSSFVFLSFSVSTTIGNSDIIPNSNGARYLISLHSFLIVIYLGLLAGKLLGSSKHDALP